MAPHYRMRYQNTCAAFCRVIAGGDKKTEPKAVTAPTPAPAAAKKTPAAAAAKGGKPTPKQQPAGGKAATGGKHAPPSTTPAGKRGRGRPPASAAAGTAGTCLSVYNTTHMPAGPTDPSEAQSRTCRNN